MAYKISGVTTHDCRVIVLKKSDYSVESNTLVSGTIGASGNFTYEISGLEVGEKLVIGQKDDGWSQCDVVTALSE